MKKLSILIILAVLSLSGAHAYAHEDGENSSSGPGAGLNAGVRVNIGGDSSDDRGGEDRGGFSSFFRGRGEAETEIHKSDDHAPGMDDHGGFRGDMRFGGGVGFHGGNIPHSLHDRAKMRFEIAIDRMTKLQERLQSRLDTLKSEGKDTASAQTSLDLSVSKLKEGSNYAADAKVIIEAHTGATPPTELSDSEKAQVKELFEKSKTSLKASLDALKESLRITKGLSVDASSKTSASSQ